MLVQVGLLEVTACTDTTRLPLSSTMTFSLVLQVPFSGRPDNAHAALQGCKQDTAVQDTTIFSIWAHHFHSLIWVAMCPLQASCCCDWFSFLMEVSGRNLCLILAWQARRKDISVLQLEVCLQPRQIQQSLGSETVRRMLSWNDHNPKMLQFIFLPH